MLDTLVLRGGGQRRAYRVVSHAAESAANSEALERASVAFVERANLAAPE